MNKRLVKKVMAACTARAIAGALVLIPAYEGVEYMPYRDVAGVLTVCYGHTGSDIQPGKLYTDAECKALLHDDLTKVRRAVDPMIKVPIDDNTRRPSIHLSTTSALARSRARRCCGNSIPVISRVPVAK